MPISSETDKPANAEETEMNTLNSFFSTPQLFSTLKKTIIPLLICFYSLLLSLWFMDGFSMNMPSANDLSGLDFGSQTLNFLKLKQKKRKLFSELACIELYHLT